MNDNDKIFVVAGTYFEFKQFMHKKLDQLWKQYNEEGRMFNLSMSNFVYVSSLESLAGHRNIHGYFYGTFRNRPDLKDIVRHIRLRNGLPASEQLIPDVYVGRGMAANPTMPYSNNVIVHVGGVLISNSIAIRQWDSISVELPDAPPAGYTVSITTKNGTTMAYLGDGLTNKFTFYEATMQP